jgi:hypothetical protein
MAHRIKALAAAAGMAGLLAAAAPATAFAADTASATKSSTVRPDAGWLGTCYGTYVSSRVAGGWCDGNGPDWVYQGFAECSNGGYYYGVVRWAGDRRESYGTCPSGTVVVGYGVDTWYQ